MDARRFALLSATVCLLALVVALGGAFLGPSDAFRGSMAASALVGLVFAVYNLQRVRATGAPQFATGVVLALFGGWLGVAPLQYDPGFAATAAVQFPGLLLVAFGGHTALDAVAAWFE
jgi:hypothetical protein